MAIVGACFSLILSAADLIQGFVWIMTWLKWNYTSVDCPDVYIVGNQSGALTQNHYPIMWMLTLRNNSMRTKNNITSGALESSHYYSTGNRVLV